MLTKQNMIILHWEYDEVLFPNAVPESPTYEILFTKDVSSERATGISFKWSYKIFKDHQPAFVCTAKDTYQLKNGKADYYLMKYLLENSFYIFKVTLQQKLNIIGLQIIKPDFSREKESLSQAAELYNLQSG